MGIVGTKESKINRETADVILDNFYHARSLVGLDGGMEASYQFEKHINSIVREKKAVKKLISNRKVVSRFLKLVETKG